MGYKRSSLGWLDSRKAPLGRGGGTYYPEQSSGEGAPPQPSESLEEEGTEQLAATSEPEAACGCHGVWPGGRFFFPFLLV